MEWSEQDAKDARRLIGVMDERAKRKALAGGVGLEPAEIHKSSKSRLDKTAEGENVGLGTFDRSPPIAAAKGC